MSKNVSSTFTKKTAVALAIATIVCRETPTIIKNLYRLSL